MQNKSINKQFPSDFLNRLSNLKGVKAFSRCFQNKKHWVNFECETVTRSQYKNFSQTKSWRLLCFVTLHHTEIMKIEYYNLYIILFLRPHISLCYVHYIALHCSVSEFKPMKL